MKIRSTPPNRLRLSGYRLCALIIGLLLGSGVLFLLCRALSKGRLAIAHPRVGETEWISFSLGDMEPRGYAALAFYACFIVVGLALSCLSLLPDPLNSSSRLSKAIAILLVFALVSGGLLQIFFGLN